MPSRIKQVISTFYSRKIDAYLVTKDINITYLTQFPASESWLLITAQRTFYITDFRYVLEVQKMIANKKTISIVQYTTSSYSTLSEIIRNHKIRRLGLDANHLTVFQYEQLQKYSPRGVRLVAVNGLVEKFREIKEDGEILKFKRALKIHAKTLQYIKNYIRPCISEKEILFKLEDFVRSQKAGFSFPPIVVSGPNTCYPHAKVTNRKFRRDDVVLLDTGIALDGYKTDLTRMVLLGKIPQLVRDVILHVRRAQRQAIYQIQAGAAVADIDRVARNYLEKQKLAKYFGHALGHGVGLEIHEAPRLSQQSHAILSEGMVITIEPAVYIPNKFGVRIEDMVLVKKNGCEILSDDID